MPRHPWTQPELDRLDAMAGTTPWHLFCRAYNGWASANGYPSRTTTALRNRLQKMGHGMSVSGGDWLTTGDIAAIAEISPGRPENWVARFRDILQPACRHRYYIHRRNLRKLARQHPRLFGGISEGSLNCLLEDENLAAEIAAAYPNPPLPLHQKPLPVLCVETGVTYPSQTAAARAHHVVPYSICWAIKHNQPIAGFHWKRA